MKDNKEEIVYNEGLLSKAEYEIKNSVDLEVLKKLIKEEPNDGSLGKLIRSLYGN